ncbi:MAG: rhodanese-like domain-containing protein [Clostridia bacterium]
MEQQVKEILPSELLAKLEKGEKLQLIDVREPEEWNAGHIKQATLIPLGFLPYRLEELDKETPLVMICRSGARSHRACEYLQELGYDATNMVGGMLSWPGEMEK